jgi:hypothetical protein
MKALFIGIIILSTIVINACSVTRNIDTTGFTISGNVVSYNNKPMAELKGIEFALDNKKFVKEMSFSLLHGDDNDKIRNLIAFLHNHYKEYEIEIEIPMDSFKVE